AATASADIDNTGNPQGWGYVKTGNTTAPFNATAANGECVAGGVWDSTLGTPAATLTDTVGPCNGSSGQSVF
ncbi:MAG: hypothetical protein VCE43_14790, partial [Myxococcota bacterium]